MDESKALDRAAGLTRAAEEFRKRGRDTVKETREEKLDETALARIAALERRYIDVEKALQLILQVVEDHKAQIAMTTAVTNVIVRSAEEAARKAG